MRPKRIKEANRLRVLQAYFYHNEAFYFSGESNRKFLIFGRSST